ncbi:hypothetical protein, partial [Streptomyces triticisoli]|uniref:hypothetical protein n=1 Tax=Streptomyces triticisoli TaxID=2182797 RepID=UPI001E63D797
MRRDGGRGRLTDEVTEFIEPGTAGRPVEARPTGRGAEALVAPRGDAAQGRPPGRTAGPASAEAPGDTA